MPTPRSNAALAISVVRSGGFAGLTHEWTVTAAPDERAEWDPLVKACPWGDKTVDSQSRDRFTWTIIVRVSRRKKKAQVPDSALVGPWRELVDQVQARSA